MCCSGIKSQLTTQRYSTINSILHTETDIKDNSDKYYAKGGREKESKNYKLTTTRDWQKQNCNNPCQCYLA